MRVQTGHLCWLLAAVLAAGCSPPAPRKAVIGYAFPSWSRDVVVAARAEIALNPVEGVEIELVYDSAVTGDPAHIEVGRAERLAAIPGLVGIVGHGGSRGSLVAAPVYNEAGIPHIAPTSTSRMLAHAGPWTFTLAPDDSVEGSFLARFAARGLGLRRLTVFYVNDEYGVGLRDGALPELLRLGVTVVDQVPYRAASDLATLVEASLRRGLPEAMLVAGRAVEAGQIARLAQDRVPGLRVVAGDGALRLPALTEFAGPAADSIYVVALWVPDSTNPREEAYRRLYAEVTGQEAQATAAMSRDAIMLLVEAVREVGPDREAVRDWLLSLGRSRPLFDGVTGQIGFGANRRSRLSMVRIRNGQPERVPFE